MLTIEQRSPVPIYEQIKTGLLGLVARRLLKPGDQVPAIRSLAESLLVNPNTVARAYRELILEGFLESRRGEGNFISPNAIRHARNGLGEARTRLLETIQTCRKAGLTWRDIRSVVQSAKEGRS